MAFFLAFIISFATHSIIKIGGEKGGNFRTTNSCEEDAERSPALTPNHYCLECALSEFGEEWGWREDTHGPQKPDVILAEK